MAREYVWLWDYRHGIKPKAIAIREGVTVQRVEFGIDRAQAQEKAGANSTAVRPPRLVPLFPIGSYTPLSPAATSGQSYPARFFAAWYATVRAWMTTPRSSVTRSQNPLPSQSPLRHRRSQLAKHENNAASEYSAPIPDAGITRR